MKHLKRFNEEIGSEYQSFHIEGLEYEFIDATSKGVVEHGSVTMTIEGEEISLSVEESSDGSFRVFLDDMDKKDLIPSEFDSDDDIDEITNDEFIEMVWDFYESTTREKR